MAQPTKVQAYRSMKRMYKRYIRFARRRNVFWDLTIEQFHTLTSSNCVYCGKVPSQVANNYKYNGIDRLDPKQGYLPENCKPCCKECNWIKGDRLTYDEMKVVGEALSNFRKKKK